jgi:hypothetical protein
MKTAFLNTLVAAVALSTLAACGVGVEHDDQYTAQQQKDSDALNSQYENAKGLYTGAVTFASGDVANQPARLELYVAQVDAGSNPDGSRRMQPVLMGRFRLENIYSSTDYTEMIGRYDAFSGSISLSATSSGGAAGATDGTSILVRGNVGGDAANVIIQKEGRDWGRFTGSRVSKAVTAPISNDEVERRQRLWAVYRNIEGSYQSVIDTGSQRIPVTLTISVKEKPSDSPGVSIPVLVAQYRRRDVPTGIGEYQLAVSYDQLSNRMSMIATSGGSPSVPGSDYLSASGTWVNGTLDVTLRDRNGYAGQLKAQRIPYRD